MVHKTEKLSVPVEATALHRRNKQNRMISQLNSDWHDKESKI